MSPFAIVVIVVLVLLLLLIVGGVVATARRSRAEEGDLRTTLREADQALAMARAQDRGWERTTLEAAAREAFAARSPADVRELQLIQVIDRPGTEDDQALFRVVTDVGSEEILLARRGGAWQSAEAL